MTVRPLRPDDAGWAAGLMEHRRQVYAAYSPVFWRPAPDATGLHADFLREQIASASSVSLRTERGFLISRISGDEGLVDDFAVGSGGIWDSDGTALLLAAWHRLSAAGIHVMRVVTAQADEAKVAMLRKLSMRLAEQWWVNPVTPGHVARSQDSPLGQVEGKPL